MSAKIVNPSVGISETDNRWGVFGVCANLKTVGDLGILSNHTSATPHLLMENASKESTSQPLSSNDHEYQLTDA